MTLDESDLPDLAALCAATLVFDDCSPALLRYTLFGDEEAAELRLGLRANGRLLAVAIGAYSRHQERGVDGHIKLVATAPEAQRQGHARRLLGELEARFRAAGAAAVRLGFSRRYLLPGVDLRYSRALCLFDRLGYQRQPFTYNVGVDLTRRSFDPAPLCRTLATDGITVRHVERDDQSAFANYLQTRWSAGWTFEGLQALDLNQEPVPAHIALYEGEIVGFAVYDVTRPGWLGPIGTNAEFRGRDVGTALLHACLFDWQRNGSHYGEVAGIGPLYFYVSACDGVISRAFQRYVKPLTEGEGLLR